MVFIEKKRGRQKIAPRLIDAVVAVKKIDDVVWKTSVEFSKALFAKETTPTAEIYLIELNKRFCEVDRLKKIMSTSKNKNLLEFVKTINNAKARYKRWFAQTKQTWQQKYAVKLSEKPSAPIKDFALAGENYRAVLFAILQDLKKLITADKKFNVLWKFVDYIAAEKGLQLTKYKEGASQKELKKNLKTLGSEIQELSLGAE